MSAGRVLQGVSYAQGGSVCRKAGCARARSIASARPPRNGERGAGAAAAQPRERWSSADMIDLDSPQPPGSVRSAARARPAEDSSPAPRCRRRHTLEDSSDDERAGAAPAGRGRARGEPETAAMGRGGAAAATDDGGAAAMAVDAPEGAAAGHGVAAAAAAAANGPEAAAAGGDGPGPRDAPRAAQPAGLAELAAAAAAGAALHARVPRCRIATHIRAGVPRAGRRAGGRVCAHAGRGRRRLRRRVRRGCQPGAAAAHPRCACRLTHSQQTESPTMAASAARALYTWTL